MLPKPKHLGVEYGSQFKDQAIVDVYDYRPAYPSEIFTILNELITDKPRTLLDVGCGLGDIARPMAGLVERVDAVDFSAAMIEKGKQLPGGDSPNLSWINSPVEEAPLNPPYALITAADSVHWMEWDIVFPRFAELLSPNGFFAIVNRSWFGSPEVDGMVFPIIRQFSTNRDYQPYVLLEELEKRNLFKKSGEKSVTISWQPTVEEYIECRHSQNGLSRQRMGDEQAIAFDNALRQAIFNLRDTGKIMMQNNRLELTVVASVMWGKPQKI